jgi:SAM-dependent methyltransferase
MNTPDEVLASERRFFDEEALQLRDQDLVLPRSVFTRYSNATIGPLNIPKDTFFARLRPLEGKRVLDYGCGNGENSAILAGCGATVVGFDLSPEAIRKCRRRAELNGLSARTTFEVKHAGETGYEPASFDAVVAFAVLHHLHTILPIVFKEISTLLKPGGLACIVEPMADNRLLRIVRPLVPVPTYATEHERQLTRNDLKEIDNYFSVVDRYYYYNLERLERILGSKLGLRLRLVDHHLQRRIPMLRSLYGHLLIIAQR